MNYLFHGDNSTLSFTAAEELVGRLKVATPDAELLRLDGATLTQTFLIESLEAQSMFSEVRIIVVDNLLSRRPSKEKDTLIAYLVRALHASNLNLILWESKTVTAAVLKKLWAKEIRIQEFKLTKTLWKFLESLRPQNSHSIVSLFESTVRNEPAELVMYWIVRRISELFLAKSSLPHALDSVKSDWQRENVKRQASLWTEDQLVTFHRKLLEIDELTKTGGTPIDLRTHLDILLASL